MKIILPGGAGLVGQNLVILLKARGFTDIVVLDKHRVNLAIFQKLHPDVIAHYADFAEQGNWTSQFKDADVVVMLQAQIGGNNPQQFIRNNIDSTRLILDQIKYYKISRLIHVSSSVTESSADDFYTNTKKEQESLVVKSGIPSVILRPTLMFGWFDRKHLGWLSRFMQKSPIFPIPGKGQYPRQPLFVRDFCNIIISCIENKNYNGIYNISGYEYINYIDVVFEIKKAIKAKSKILKLPYKFFYALLRVWEFFDNNPPFTTQQLAALVAKDNFEVIDWPSIFNVSPTPFSMAIHETFNDSRYGKIVLEF
ncbi:MAG: NAD(P)-dependent oxidoreductase [Gammaproteobacteria bacterium]|nr:NAD(P)-dependent oxidoreductase [Gammaproteobacteria bacterium]